MCNLFPCTFYLNCSYISFPYNYIRNINVKNCLNLNKVSSSGHNGRKIYDFRKKRWCTSKRDHKTSSSLGFTRAKMLGCGQTRNLCHQAHPSCFLKVQTSFPPNLNFLYFYPSSGCHLKKKTLPALIMF